MSVALQLPIEGDAAGNLSRLTDKFPSNTPIWQILRRFEAGAAGTDTAKANHNFTQRATPLMSGGPSGAGRLCYETPVVNVMGRDLGSFVDLQKTLGQMGFNSGSCLLRLSYKKTEQPLEEAMSEISQYFAGLEEPSTNTMDTHGADGRDVGTAQSQVSPEGAEILDGVAGEPLGSADAPMADAGAHETEVVAPVALVTEDNTSINPTSPTEPLPQDPPPPSEVPRLVIFAPPSSTTPAAATTSDYDESDYIPSIVHAQQHQALLNKESRNRRLLSDNELAAQASARVATLANIKAVMVRLRFPDQSQVQQEYDRNATAGNLYEICRIMMNRPNDESFSLRIAAPAATAGSVRSPGGMTTLRDSQEKLIADLGWQGRVLVTVIWGDDVGAEVRKGPCLKQEYIVKAEPLKVELPKDDEASGSKTSSAPQQGAGAGAGETGKGGSGNKEAKMMRFLKGLSKK